MRTVALLLFLAASGGCGPKPVTTECDRRMNDCLRNCEVQDSPVERDFRRDPSNDMDDSRTECQQACDEVCK